MAAQKTEQPTRRRMDDARKTLERLKPLDAGRAGELAELIAKAK